MTNDGWGFPETIQKVRNGSSAVSYKPISAISSVVRNIAEVGNYIADAHDWFLTN
jgi:hypothetical protein